MEVLSIISNNGDRSTCSRISQGSSSIGINYTQDSLLADVIRSDRYLMLFMKVAGVTIVNDDRDGLIVRMIALTWTAILLLLAGIGLGWCVFVDGIYYINLMNQSNEDNAIPFEILIGHMIRNFILPLLQTGSLMYSMLFVFRQLRQTFIYWGRRI